MIKFTSTNKQIHLKVIHPFLLTCSPVKRKKKIGYFKDMEREKKKIWLSFFIARKHDLKRMPLFDATPTIPILTL